MNLNDLDEGCTCMSDFAILNGEWIYSYTITDPTCEHPHNQDVK